MKLRVSWFLFVIAVAISVAVFGCVRPQPQPPESRPRPLGPIDVIEAITSLCPAIQSNPQILEDTKRTCNRFAQSEMTPTTKRSSE